MTTELEQTPEIMREKLENLFEHPPRPKPVPREEGQCDWCSFRVTDVCSLGHSTKDHCMGMGHRCLKCNSYKWYGSPHKEIEKLLTRM